MKRLLLIFLILLTFSCSPGTFISVSSKDPKPITTDSIVTLITPQIVIDADGVPAGLAYYASCNAFFANYYGHDYLITAAHCVHGSNVGDRIDYLSPTGLGADHATLVDADPTFDTAVLVPASKHVVALPTDISYEINAGDTVFSCSTMFRSTVLGNIIGELTYGWFDTTQTVGKGWSGAPVINGEGNVIGLISMCRWITEEDRCQTSYAIVAKLK